MKVSYEIQSNVYPLPSTFNFGWSTIKIFCKLFEERSNALRSTIAINCVMSWMISNTYVAVLCTCLKKTKCLKHYIGHSAIGMDCGAALRQHRHQQGLCLESEEGQCDLTYVHARYKAKKISLLNRDACNFDFLHALHTSARNLACTKVSYHYTAWRISLHQNQGWGRTIASLPE